MIKQGLAAMLAMSGISAFGATLAASSFDVDSEGWIAQNGATSFQWMATGGESGGFVRATDASGGLVWSFSAPVAYLGDQGAAYGGSLSFFLRALPQANPFELNYPDVKLVGATMTLAIDAGPSPGSGWTAYNVPLVANGQWRIDSLDGPAASAADLQAVLGSLSAVRIRGEFSNSVDVGGLDSVMLSSAAPVPEPATGAMLIAGLLGLSLLTRRR